MRMPTLIWIFSLLKGTQQAGTCGGTIFLLMGYVRYDILMLLEISRLITGSDGKLS